MLSDQRERPEGQSFARMEAALIKKISISKWRVTRATRFETFESGRLGLVTDDFFLLKEYVTSTGSDQFKRICERWGQFAETGEETELHNEKIADPSAQREAQIVRARAKFQPLFTFLVALCHALQESEENYLSAHDCVWLGLVDEVWGTNLPSMRLLSEFRPDPSKA